MTKTLAKTTALSVLALAVGSGIAFAELKVGDTLGTTEAEIQAALEAQGATIEEIETEDGMIEVEFTIAGAEQEVEVDPSTGAIVEIEADDEDGDDEDDDSDEDETEDDDKK